MIFGFIVKHGELTMIATGNVQPSKIMISQAMLIYFTFKQTHVFFSMHCIFNCSEVKNQIDAVKKQKLFNVIYTWLTKNQGLLENVAKYVLRNWDSLPQMEVVSQPPILIGLLRSNSSG